MSGDPAPLSADEVARLLGLVPHPEGGHYRETFRDEAAGSNRRAASTAIYFLLRRGERSHWHRVRDAAEVWHHYGGAPLALHRSADGRASETLTLGPDLLAGERPQAIIPADWWQSAETLGEFTLMGCTVAPGFEFASFEMAPPDWKPGG